MCKLYGSMPYGAILNMALSHLIFSIVVLGVIALPDERKPQSDDKYIIRFPDGMRDRLKESAKVNNRSLNAEIVARLETSFQQSGPISAADNSVIKAIEKSNLETRLMDLLSQWHHENHNLQHYEARLESFEDDKDSYEDLKYLRSTTEEDRSACLRTLGSLDEAIRATCSTAKQKGIELNLEEMKKRFK